MSGPGPMPQADSPYSAGEEMDAAGPFPADCQSGIGVTTDSSTSEVCTWGRRVGAPSM